MPRDPPTFLVPLALAIALLMCGASAQRRWLRNLLLVIIFILSGAAAAQFETWRSSTVVLDSPVTTVVTGEVYRREPAGAGRWRYYAHILTTEQPAIRRPPEKVVLLARSKQEPFEAGEVLRGRARLSPPSGPALPGLNDFAFRSYHDGIGAVGFFYGAPQPATSHREAAGSWTEEWGRLIFQLRGTIADRIRATVPGDAGAFAAAIVTDERRAISKETTEALRVSGLAHIVAISGLNMALAAGIFFVGLRSSLGLFTGLAQAWPIKKIAAGGALVMATAYYLISGFAVSAERAYLMMAVMLIAVLLDRAAISLRNVAIAALAMLMVSPSEVMGPSFQMSFAATIALIAGYAFWSRWKTQREQTEILPVSSRLVPIMVFWQFMIGIFATSLIGGLSTAIYSMEHFHRLPGYGLVANLAVMPIISFVVMPAGLVGMLLMPFGLDAPFLKLMGQGLQIVIEVAKVISSWGGEIDVGRQHGWFLPMATAGFLLLVLLRSRLRLSGLPLLLGACLLSWQAQREPAPEVLIAEDGALVALLQARLATNRARPPAFIFDQWQRALQLSQPEPPVVSSAGDTASAGGSGDRSRKGAMTDEEIARARAAIRQALITARSNPGRFHCREKAWCIAVTEEGAKIAVVEDGRLAGLGCDVATLVIAPRAPFNECHSGALLLGGAALKKTGSLEIHLNDSSDPRKWTIIGAMTGVDRPWSRHRSYDWKTGEFDPSAPQSLANLFSDSDG